MTAVTLQSRPETYPPPALPDTPLSPADRSVNCSHDLGWHSARHLACAIPSCRCLRYEADQSLTCDGPRCTRLPGHDGEHRPAKRGAA